MFVNVSDSTKDTNFRDTLTSSTVYKDKRIKNTLPLFLMFTHTHFVWASLGIQSVFQILATLLISPGLQTTDTWFDMWQGDRNKSVKAEKRDWHINTNSYTYRHTNSQERLVQRGKDAHRKKGREEKEKRREEESISFTVTFSEMWFFIKEFRQDIKKH